MNSDSILQLCREEIFSAAAIIDMDDVVVNAGFRPYCEQNLCGQYNANYSCPPDCGDPAEMEARLRSYSHALVLQTKWAVENWRDSVQIRRAKNGHNQAMLRVIGRMRRQGLHGLMAGASCCTLCERCVKPEGSPCPQPKVRFSCLSAYCVYVKKLADACGMEYDCADGSLALFGMYAF